MANKKAARKSMIQSKRRASENSVVIGKLRTLAKKLRVAIGAGMADVQSMARDYISAVDKAAKRNVIHRNSANRRKRTFARFALDT